MPHTNRVRHQKYLYNYDNYMGKNGIVNLFFQRGGTEFADYV